MFNIADNRIYMNDENGKMIAEVTFPNLDDKTIVIDHTPVFRRSTMKVPTL